MEKYPSIPKLGDPDAEPLFSSGDIIVTEKIDGANFRFKLTDSGALLFGRRSGMFRTPDGEPKPVDECDERFRHAMSYIYETIDLTALQNLYDAHGELWFYGECLYQHSLIYDKWDGAYPSPESDIPNFLGFDIYSVEHEAFLPFEKMQDAYETIGLETTPLIETTDAESLRRDGVTIPQSAYRTPNPDAASSFDRHGLAEGVVLRNLSNGQKAKHVHDAFSERNAISFNEAASAQTISGAYVAKYITDARVRKHAHKLLDEGLYDELSLRMLDDLPDRVVDDAFDEEGRRLHEGNDVAIEDSETERLVRKKAGRKCNHVLQKMLAETRPN